MSSALRSGLAVGAYIAVLAAVIWVGSTDADENPSGIVILVVPLLAHVMLGAVIRRWWVLVFPIALGAAVGLDAYDEDALGALAGVLAGGYGLVATTLGVAVGRRVIGHV